MVLGDHIRTRKAIKKYCKLECPADGSYPVGLDILFYFFSIVAILIKLFLDRIWNKKCRVHNKNCEEHIHIRRNSAGRLRIIHDINDRKDQINQHRNKNNHYTIFRMENIILTEIVFIAFKKKRIVNYLQKPVNPCHESGNDKKGDYKQLWIIFMFHAEAQNLYFKNL